MVEAKLRLLPPNEGRRSVSVFGGSTMFVRSPWKLLLLVGFALTLAGCTNNLVDSIVIAPSTQTLAVGQTVQFTATGYQSHGTHPSTSEIVTNQCAWSSSAPSIVTISSTG